MPHPRPLRDLPLDQLDLNEPARPTAPAYLPLTAFQKQAGQHLMAIHRMHLRELSKARMVLRHVTEGQTDPSALVEALRDLDLSQNFRLFGNLCGQECRMLQFHHDAEEAHMFPALEATAPEPIRRIVAKLRAEHEVVHELLDRLSEAAETLALTPSEAAFTEAHRLFDKFEAVVRSHFGYEETELKDALGVHVGHI